MSADNGYILRQDPNGKFVLQMYFASANEYPSIYSKHAMRFDTLQEAVFRYQEIEKEEYPTEYGLTVNIEQIQEKNVMHTEKFVRKPFYVDAVQVSEENLSEVSAWANADIRTDEKGEKYIQVRVHRPLNERQTRAYIGDWVLYAGTGFKVYTPKAFNGCFESAEKKLVIPVEHIETAV